MGLGRWFWKWSARRGNYGGTARTVGNQYNVMRASDPNKSRQDILEEIVDFRHSLLPYSPDQMARLRLQARRDHTLTEFVMEIVLAEANTDARDLGNGLPLFREVIEEELDKLGLSDERVLMPLHVAAQGGDLQQVQAELAKVPDVDLRDPVFGRTALGHAASKGHTHVVQFLLARGAKAHYRDSSGGTPLHHASMMGRADVVALLIAHGGSVDAKAEGDLWHGSTPLHCAVSTGSAKVEVVELLLSHGASLDALNDVGATPLDMAESAGETEVAQILREHQRAS